MGYQKVYGEGRERAVERGGACVFRAGHYDLGKMEAVLGCAVEVGSSQQVHAYHAVTTGRHGTDRVRGEDSRKGVHIHNPRLRLSGV